MVKNLPAMWATQVQALVQEDPMEKGKPTNFSILAWRLPGTEEPGGLQSMGSQSVRHDSATNAFTFTYPPTGPWSDISTSSLQPRMDLWAQTLSSAVWADTPANGKCYVGHFSLGTHREINQNWIWSHLYPLHIKRDRERGRGELWNKLCLLLSL